MWARFCLCLLFLAFFAADPVTTECSLVPADIDDSVVLWTNLFSQINKIISEKSGQSENQKALSKTLLELIERQEKQDTKLSEFIEKSDRRHEKLETQLSDFIRRIETSFSNLEKSTQNDLMTIKNGLQQQQNNLSHLMAQYLDSNAEWTTVLRRQDGSVDFYRNWNEYQKGFGDPDGEFFIGLEKLHNLTTLGEPQELLIVLKDYDNIKKIARYDKFKIGNSEEKYQLLELGKYSGDAGDSLKIHRNMKFSTIDNDNDDKPDLNCAEYFKGSWWFHKCYRSHLFGPYGEKDGVAWLSWKEEGSGLKFAEMKIRSKFN